MNVYACTVCIVCVCSGLCRSVISSKSHQIQNGLTEEITIRSVDVCLLNTKFPSKTALLYIYFVCYDTEVYTVHIRDIIYMVVLGLFDASLIIAKVE